MNMNLPKYSKGFTLIELLVVISIIAIIGGGIIPSFSKYVRDQNLKQAQEQLKSDLRTIQNKALTGALSSSSISGVRVRYWGVRLLSGSETLDYFISTSTANCPPTYSPTANYNGIRQGSFKIPNTIVYKGGTGCMFFDIRNGDITNSGVSNPIPLNYVNPTGVAYKYINFTTAGSIY